MNAPAEKAPMSAEQAADLAALEAAAAGAQPAAPVPGADPQAAPQEISLDRELAGMAHALVAALAPALPSLKTIYTEEVIAAASASVAAVCRKHGWLEGGLMGEWSEEITCGMICVPLAITTAQAVKADLAVLKAKAGEAAPQVGGAVSPAPTSGGDGKVVPIRPLERG